MSIFLGLLINVLEEGFIYAIMAMGVVITYSIMAFPDLSVDGTFPLGACIAAALINFGFNPWLVCLISFGGGLAAGTVTGLLHVKLKISDLLSGILVMTALWSVNLIITGNSAVLPFFDKPTIFNSGPAALLPSALSEYHLVKVIIAFVCAILVKLVLDWYLKTKSGMLLRAAGDNAQFVTSAARDPGKMKILGLALGNGCTALSGCILAQQSESANVSSGTGMVVMALASVIIGTSIFKRLNLFKATTMAIFGTIIYKACLSIAMQLGLPTTYLKILMAALFTLALMSNNLMGKRRKSIE